jgi:hypothetical protein
VASKGVVLGARVQTVGSPPLRMEITSGTNHLTFIKIRCCSVRVRWFEEERRSAKGEDEDTYLRQRPLQVVGRTGQVPRRHLQPSIHRNPCCSLIVSCCYAKPKFGHQPSIRKQVRRPAPLLPLPGRMCHSIIRASSFGWSQRRY